VVFPATVFFIAKLSGISSIRGMIQRLIMIAAASLLALAMSSCCCLFS
jgi:hypothetical protein